MTTQKKEGNISWKKIQKIKIIHEKSVALHFARSMYVYDNQNTNLLSQSQKKKVKEHIIDIVSRMWRKYVTKQIEMLKENS